MSDQTSVLQIKLLSAGDFSALTKGKEQSEALKISLEGLRSTLSMLGTGVSFGALVEGTRAAIEYGSALNDLSYQAGISVQAFQSLAYVADAAGTKQDELGGILNVLARNLAEAADGAGKQNRAIADLGLNTAELLAMPVEQQVEAIAKAYANAADKGRAWADIIALLGKGSPKIKEMFEDIGVNGIGNRGPTASNENIARLDKAGDTASKVGRMLKTAGAEAVAEWLGAFDAIIDKANALHNKNWGITPGASPAVSQDKPQTAAEKAAQIVASIEGDAKMISAKHALAQAIADEGKAYELPIEAAKRLRSEATAAEEQAAKLRANKFIDADQLAAVQLQTEAARLRLQANQEDAKALKDQAQHAAALSDLYGKLTQQGMPQGPLQEQIAQAKGREMGLARELDSLSEKSLTHDKDEERILREILAVKTEISTLEERDAMRKVEQASKNQQLANQMQSIALAAIEHDYNLTDAEKWDQKRKLIGSAIAEQERYVARQRAMSKDSSMSQGARDRAANEAESGENHIAGLRGDMGAMGPNPRSFTENFSAGLKRLQSQWGTLQQQMAGGLTGAISAGLNSVSGNLSKLVLGAQTLGQAFRNIAVDIGTTLVQAFVDMGVKWVANKIMMATVDKGIAAASTAAMIPLAMAQSAIWAAPATLATIASWGGAAAAAPLEIMAALGMTQAMALAGFEGGGLTGGREGRVAGVVHGEEFVWSAPAVRNIGAGNLERAHQAAISGGAGAAGVGSGGRGGNMTFITAMSPEDVARSQRRYMDARVARGTGRIPTARFAM